MGLPCERYDSCYGNMDCGVFNWGIIERFLPKNQHTLRKLLNFENWTSGEPQRLAKSEFLKLIILIFHEKLIKTSVS